MANRDDGNTRYVRRSCIQRTCPLIPAPAAEIARHPTIEEAAAALASGRTSSRELVEACLQRIADPAGQGAVAFINVFENSARITADAIDTLRKANRLPSPYAGIPITVKDLFDIAGEPTCAGSRVLANAPKSHEHASVVQRLVAAGFVLIGRTNMTEFAFSGIGINPHYGTPLSPWDRATGRIPGGSSSGAAVSISDGFAIGSIGTDTGGSCRIPAALCGITGFKPTARRIPMNGVLPLSPTLDSVGPLAKSAACCAALDAVMAGTPGRRLSQVHPSGLRFLLPTNLAFANIDDATEAAFDRAVALLDSAGVVIDRRPVGSFDDITAAHENGGFAAAEAFSWHKTLLAKSSGQYDSRVAGRIASGANMSAADYFTLTQARKRIIKRFNAELAGHDALMLPTVPIQPPALADFGDDDNYKRLNFLLLRNPSTINFVDGCAISLPCHAVGAPPGGLMLALPAMHDQRLLEISVTIQRVLELDSFKLNNPLPGSSWRTPRL